MVLLVGVGGARAARHAASGPVKPDSGRRSPSLVPGDACLTADDPTWILVAGRSPKVGGRARQIVDVFGERVLRATAGGTVRFASVGELLLSDASQDVLVGYLERCPYVVVGDGTADWMPDRVSAFQASHQLIADWTAEGGPQLWGPIGAAPS